MISISMAAVAWLYSPYSRVRQDHFILFSLAFGVGFGKMATKIIYAHLTKRKFPYHSGLMLPLFGGATFINLPLILPIKSILSPFGETLYLWCWMTLAAIGYAKWSYHLVNSFCKYLNINCFSLKQQRSKTR